MLLDISRAFEDIYTSESFRDALANLSTVLRPHNESEAWARRLRFLCPGPAMRQRLTSVTTGQTKEMSVSAIRAGNLKLLVNRIH